MQCRLSDRVAICKCLLNVSAVSFFLDISGHWKKNRSWGPSFNTKIRCFPSLRCNFGNLAPTWKCALKLNWIDQFDYFWAESKPFQTLGTFSKGVEKKHKMLVLGFLCIKIQNVVQRFSWFIPSMASEIWSLQKSNPRLFVEISEMVSWQPLAGFNGLQVFDASRIDISFDAMNSHLRLLVESCQTFEKLQIFFDKTCII